MPNGQTPRKQLPTNLQLPVVKTAPAIDSLDWANKIIDKHVLATTARKKPYDTTKRASEGGAPREFNQAMEHVARHARDYKEKYDTALKGFQAKDPKKTVLTDVEMEAITPGESKKAVGYINAYSKGRTATKISQEPLESRGPASFSSESKTRTIYDPTKGASTLKIGAEKEAADKAAIEALKKRKATQIK